VRRLISGEKTGSAVTDVSDAPHVLQFCHGYDGPFLDCARQYAGLFQDTPYCVTTVFLTGAPNEEIKQGCASDEVIFLGYSSTDGFSPLLEKKHTPPERTR
jgi:hypothetical protein